MLLRVMYHDQRYDFIKASRLNEFIEAGTLAKFQRGGGWARVPETVHLFKIGPEKFNPIVLLFFVDNRRQTWHIIISDKTFAGCPWCSLP